MGRPRQAIRRFGRQRPLSVTAVLLVAIAWGAMAVCVRAGRGVLSPELPIQERSKLISIYRGRDPVMPLGASPTVEVSYNDLAAISASDAVVSVAASAAIGADCRVGARLFDLRGEAVNDAYFSTLRFEGLVGTGLDGQSGQPDVVLSERFVTKAYPAKKPVIGSTVHLGQNPYTVTGIIPATFGGIRAPTGGAIDFWITLDQAEHAGLLGGRSPQVLDPNERRFALVARVRNTARADAALGTLAKVLERENPSPSTKREFITRPFGTEVVSAAADPFARRLIADIAGGVGLLLILMTATVALLAARQAECVAHEVASRAALGATFVEAATIPLGQVGLIVLCAAPFAYCLYCVFLMGLASHFGQTLVGWWHLRPDVGTFLLSAMPCAAASLLGAYPSTRRSWRRIDWTVRSGGTGRRRFSRLTWLAASVAACLVLTAASLAFARQDSALPTLNSHYDWKEMDVSVVKPERPGESQVDWHRVEDAVRQERGLRAAGLIESLGPGGTAGFVRPTPVLNPVGVASPGRASVLLATLIGMSCGMNDTLPLHLVSGRLFRQDECTGRDRAVIVPEGSARRWWGGANPVGLVVWIDGAAWPVIGVVTDWVQNPAVWWRETAPLLVPLDTQEATEALLVRRAGVVGAPPLDARSLAGVSTRELGSPLDVSNDEFRLFEAIKSLMYVLAAASFILAMVASLALVTSDVANRRHELAVRLALGAGRKEIVRALAGGYLALMAGTAVGAGLVVMWTRPVISSFVNASLLGGRSAPFAGFLWVGALAAALALFVMATVMFAGLRAGRVDPGSVLHECM